MDFIVYKDNLFHNKDNCFVFNDRSLIWRLDILLNLEKFYLTSLGDFNYFLQLSSADVAGLTFDICCCSK